MNRRHMMASLSGIAALASANNMTASTLGSSANSAAQHGALLSVYDPRKFGALGNGRSLDTAAINAAIDACTKAGGGIVYLFPGNYLCGTLVLKSNVTLYLEAGATLLGSTNIADFGIHLGGSSAIGGKASAQHLIYAKDAEHIGICGPGRIDGQGQSYWFLKNPAPAITDHNRWKSAAQWLWDFHDRPSPLVALSHCANVRIEGVRVENSPGWTILLNRCDKVVVHGIAIKNPVYGPNTDGIDIVGSQNVMVSDCIIDTGDDAICLKSGEDLDLGGTPSLTRNIVVTNCIISGCCNGFKIGTSTFGGFENITFSNSVIFNDDVDLASRIISGIALEIVDGGWIDGVVISGIQMRRARAPIFIRLGDRNRKVHNPARGLRGVLIQGIHATDSIMTSSITGVPGMPIEDISLSDIHIQSIFPGNKEWVENPVPDSEKQYPEAWMSGWLPASGLYCRHVNGLELKDLHFCAPASEWRSTVLCDDVTRLLLNGLTTTPADRGVPPLSLTDVRSAWITAAAAPAGARALLTLQGAQCAEILVSGCDARQASTLAEVHQNVQPNTLRGEFNICDDPKLHAGATTGIRGKAS